MSKKLIPIATNVGDSIYIVGNVGEIINKQNYRELYAAIEKTLTLDSNTSENKKNQARMRIINNFSIPKIVSKYNKVYFKLMDKN